MTRPVRIDPHTGRSTRSAFASVEARPRTVRITLEHPNGGTVKVRHVDHLRHYLGHGYQVIAVALLRRAEGAV